MGRFLCDYCDVFLSHDSVSVRKQHMDGNRHRQAVSQFYQQFVGRETQEKIDRIVDEFEHRVAAGLVRPTYGVSAINGLPGDQVAPGPQAFFEEASEPGPVVTSMDEGKAVAAESIGSHQAAISAPVKAAGTGLAESPKQQTPAPEAHESRTAPSAAAVHTGNEVPVSPVGKSTDQEVEESGTTVTGNTAINADSITDAGGNGYLNEGRENVPQQNAVANAQSAGDVALPSAGAVHDGQAAGGVESAPNEIGAGAESSGSDMDMDVE